MFATAPQFEVLDLRHFSAAALRPLLEEEAARWEQRLTWDYTRSIALLLEYVDNRSLTGYVAMRHGRVAGYAFGVCEATKAVLGDVYAFGEGERRSNPACEILLEHLIETLQATPGINRIESQLLLFPDGALHGPFLSRDFRAFPRCFMVCDLSGPRIETRASPGASYVVEPWRPEAYIPASELIQSAYLGHTDSEINDQYRTLTGAQRFLHNIVHFPGCGIFDPANSWLLRNRTTNELDGVILCSRLQEGTAHITQICVRSTLRGKGFGAVLLEHCLYALGRSGIRTVSLTVTESNAVAQKLYAENGFRLRHRFEAWVWDKPRP